MLKIQNTLKKFMQAREWLTLRPSDVAKSIMIEGAELLEHFQWNSYDVDQTKADKDKMIEVQKELADVLIYSLEMAILLDLDAEKIIEAKLEHNNKKYPAALMKKWHQMKKSDAEKEYQERRKNYKA